MLLHPHFFFLDDWDERKYQHNLPPVRFPQYLETIWQPGIQLIEMGDHTFEHNKAPWFHLKMKKIHEFHILKKQKCIVPVTRFSIYVKFVCPFFYQFLNSPFKIEYYNLKHYFKKWLKFGLIKKMKAKKQKKMNKTYSPNVLFR